jgi:hypothetical protein
MATRITPPIKNAFIHSPIRTRETVFLLYAESVKAQTGRVMLVMLARNDSLEKLRSS